MTKDKSEQELAPEKDEQEPASEPKVETPDLPEKFQGKSMEDVVHMYTELESSHGEQKQQIGTLRGDLDSTKNDMAMLRSQFNQQTATQPEPPDYTSTDNNFLDQPTKTTHGIVTEQITNYDAYRRSQSAKQMAPWAKETAKQKYPDAFSGINDADVEKMINDGVQSGNLAPEFLSNPDGWAMTAWQLKGQKVGFKVDGQITPNEPTITEAPASVKKVENLKTAVNVPDAVKQIWNTAGISEEQQEKVKTIVTKGEV